LIIKKNFFIQKMPVFIKKSLSKIAKLEIRFFQKIGFFIFKNLLQQASQT